MMQIKNLDDLQKIRDAVRAEIKKREKTEKIITISMGTSGIASGAHDVKTAFEEKLSSRNIKTNIVPVGSSGMEFLEPVVIIRPDDLLYCRVEADDVNEIIERTLIKGQVIKRLLYKDKTGKTISNFHNIPFYKSQKRIVLRNCGMINPERIEEYIANEGYAALSKVIAETTPEEVIYIVSKSGLRGRGGAGFSTGMKWAFARKAPGNVKYLICNADEGDPGAFMDRCVGESDPHALLEGMAIAGYAIGAQKGYIYCRAEYPLAVKRLRTAIDQAREYGLLGTNIFGSDFSFDIELMEGAGAFVCGEETALMASIEGRRAEPRPRPPFPATSGLWGKPTNINNVKTYASIPQIILKGADWFASMGTEKSKGTAVFALAGDVNNTGLVEIPMGITLGEIILDIGGGVVKGRKFKAVQIGGPLGGCLPVELLNTPIDFESITATGAIMGSGGMIVADENTCMVELARFFLEFATNESCGKCVPCRAGGQLLLEILKRITEGKGVMKDLDMIEHISEVINKTALCNLGVLTPNPINTTVKYFKDEFLAHIIDKRCPAGVCEALVPAPCRSGCPAEVNVPIYVAHIANGEYDKALAVHRETNPFPSICGRVCPAFCEKKCRRGALDKPVAIRVLKRFMADKEIEQWKPTILEKEKEQRVAIVGGGPAGLTAALRLAQHGYKATIFEAESILGGMMAWGIPDYRLPKDVLKREIDSITSLDSIEVKLNTAVGKDISFDFLKKEYDAVLLAVGAPKSRKLGIPGEDGEGVVHGIDFLKGLNLGEDTSYVKGKRVSVIGGGDVAIDAARSLIRLGAVEVTIVYRRRREDMPAIKEEIKTAGREGVKFMFLVTPKEVANRNGKVVSLRCQKMKLEGENNRPLFDASGRKRPFPIEGAEIVLDVDMVVPAIGEGTDLSFIKESTSRIETDRGTIITDPRTFITSEKGVFAVGDVVSGPATIIDAVAQGNCVAKVIQRYLQGEEELMPPAEILKRSEGMGEFKITEGDASRPRQKQSCLTMEERKGNFREVELGFPNEKRAKAEARRCIRCDLESVE